MSTRSERRAQARAGRLPPTRTGRSSSRRHVRALAFLLVPLVSLVLLAVGVLLPVYERDWHPAVTIDGSAVGRADFRDRATVLQALGAAEAQVASGLVGAGLMTAAESSTLLSHAPTGAAAEVADSFLEERTVAEEAAKAGVAAPAARDPISVLAEAAYAPFSRRVRWLAISAPLPAAAVSSSAQVPHSGWSGAPAGDAVSPTVLAARDAAVARAGALAPSTPAADLVAQARAAGWDATGGEAWIADTGPVDGVPDALVATLRAPSLAPGSATAPFRDEATSDAVVGVLLAKGPAPDAGIVAHAIAPIRVGDRALAAWAASWSLERALESALVERWSTTPTTVVADREIPVGPVANGGPLGPTVGLAHLVVAELPASDLPDPASPFPSPFGGQRPSATPWPTAPDASPTPLASTLGVAASAGPADPRAAALAAALSALPPSQREARWEALVADANAAQAAGPHAGNAAFTSGELGWSARGAMSPALAALALTPLPTASVLGPLDTSSGPELFLVRGQFPGQVDEKSGAALTTIAVAAARGAGADGLPVEAARLAQGADLLRYDPGTTRSELELAGNDLASAALLDAPVGTTSGPLALDGQIVVVVAVSRTSATPSGEALARVQTSGFARFLAARMATHAIVLDPDPFGHTELTAAPPVISPAPTVPFPTMLLPPSAGLP